MSTRDNPRLNARRAVHQTEIDRGGVTVRKAGGAAPVKPPAPALAPPSTPTRRKKG